MSDSELARGKQRDEDEEEMEYLLDKRVRRGWGAKDADRYAMLKKRSGKD